MITWSTKLPGALLVLHSHYQRGCSEEAVTGFKFFVVIMVALMVLMPFRLSRVWHMLCVSGALCYNLRPLYPQTRKLGYHVVRIRQ